jgi:flagellar basal body-associated protein FliL
MPLLGPHLIVPAITTAVVTVVGSFFYLGTVSLSTEPEASDPLLEKRLEATGLIIEKKSAPEPEIETDESLLEAAMSQPVHRYFTFPFPFLTNLQTGQMITLELALSTTQPSNEAENFIEVINGFRPVLRSEILAYLGTLAFDRFSQPKIRQELEDEIRDTINGYLMINRGDGGVGVADVYIQKMVLS